MSYNKKHDFTLLIALAIPLLMILFIGASILIPGFYSHPKYNFIYGMYDNSGQGPAFEVVNGKLVDNSPSQVTCPGNLCDGDNGGSGILSQYAYTQLYEYIVSTKKSLTITPKQAQLYMLSTNEQSPDGYTIKNGNQDDGFFFFGGDEDTSANEYLVGHNTSSEIIYSTNGPLSNGNFYFVGWIIN